MVFKVCKQSYHPDSQPVAGKPGVSRLLFTVAFRLFRLLASLNYTLQTPNRSTEPSDSL